jgi:hypothetical protein
MITSGVSTSTNPMQRIGLWFGSLLISATLFSLFMSLLFSTAGSFRFELVFIVFRVTMMFALPVSCLYLPFVLAFKKPVGRRIWTVLVTGILVGPASLGLWGLVLLIRGRDPHIIWDGDPLLGVLGGIGAGMVFALIVGFLTTSFYVFALKVFHHRSTAQGRLTS